MEIVKTVIDFVMDILETIVFVGSLFIVIYLFIMGPNQVRGVSMQPTFETGDYILTSRITYKFRQIERGDVIVFKSPQNPDIEYIKRVIGLSGDTVIVKSGYVYVNGVELQEQYTKTETSATQGGVVKENEPLRIPKDYIFVMGDNRNESSDSRVFGPVRKSSIIGLVFYRYFPATKLGCIFNPYHSSKNSVFSLFSILCWLFQPKILLLLVPASLLSLFGLFLLSRYLVPQQRK